MSERYERWDGERRNAKPNVRKGRGLASHGGVLFLRTTFTSPLLICSRCYFHTHVRLLATSPKQVTQPSRHHGARNCPRSSRYDVFAVTRVEVVSCPAHTRCSSLFFSSDPSLFLPSSFAYRSFSGALLLVIPAANDSRAGQCGNQVREEEESVVLRVVGGGALL